MKLEIELIPSSCWFSNVRSAVTKAQWDAIRHQVYSKYYDVCEICGGVGPNHPVEAHEIWHYDDIKLIQKLIGMIALCPNCHATKHFGLSQIQGRGDLVLKHFMKINKVTQKQANKYINKIFKLWEARSQKKWHLDITHLKEYGIDITKIKDK